MTKKDYIAIAQLLKPEHMSKDEVSSVGGYKDILTYRNDLVELFADMLEKDNPRFDRERFINYINK